MDKRYVYNIVAKCFVLFDVSPLDFLNPFNFHFNFILYQFIEVSLYECVGSFVTVVFSPHQNSSKLSG